MQFESTSVALLPCSSYGRLSLMESFEALIRTTGISSRLHGRTILLKPNLLTAARGPLPCTEATFILAAARWFLDAGAKVMIGDSPAFGSARVNLWRLGIGQELRAMGVGISDFRRTRVCMMSSGVKAGIAVRALECDLLVNLPRIKAHAQTRVTMAVKNCFGCLTGLQKPWWHMVYGGTKGHFADLLVGLLACLPRTLTLVDGIRVMHRTGPINGSPYPLRVVAAGTNPVAVDTALLELLNIPRQNSPLQVAAANRNIAGSNKADLSYPLCLPDDLQVYDFQVPFSLNPIRFRPFSFAVSAARRALRS